MPSPTEITVAQLSRLIGLPDAPAIVDVRIDEDYAADPAPAPGLAPARLPHRRRVGAATTPAKPSSSPARRA